MVSLTKPAKTARNSRIATNLDSNGFWQRPAWMNSTADGLFLLGAGLLIWAGMIWLQQLPVFALRHMHVVGNTAQISRQQIEDVAKTAINGNFFTVDLAATRAAYQALPWVRRAELRRVWPDRLELTLEVHQAVAHWTPQDGEPRLVNSFGEVFLVSLDDVEQIGSLPVFDGPEGSAPRLLERFEQFRQGLSAIPLAPVAVALSPREAWRLTLDDGVSLELGRDQKKHPVADRIARFVVTYPLVRAKLQRPLQLVDMRYPNGFTVRLGGKA